MTRQELINFTRIVMMICREELAPDIHDLIAETDDGSPWGRAFMRVCELINNPQSGWADDHE